MSAGVNIGQLTAYLGLNIDRMTQGLANAKSRLGAASANMKSIGKKMTMNLTAPLVAMGGMAIKLATDFQTSFRKINTLVGLGTDRLNEMSKKTLELSNQTGRGATELGDALFAITSAGQRGAEAMQILERSAKASAIGLGDTKAIAKTVTAVLNAYGKENYSAARATDVLVGIVREGNLVAEELAPVLGRVVGMASNLGISFEEVGGSIATFTRLGVDSAEAVTGLRGLMNALLKPTKESGEALDAIGLSVGELKSKIRKDGLAKTLVMLTTEFKGQEDQLARIVPNVRALAAMLGTAGVQGEEYEEIMRKLNATLNHVDNGMAQIAGDTGFKFTQAVNTMKNAGIQMGMIMLPMFTSLVTSVKNGVLWFSSLSTGTKKLILVVAGLVAGLGPAIYLLGTLGTIIAAITSPVGLVIVAFVALVAIISHLALNWEATVERISDMAWWHNLLIDMKQLFLEYNPFALIIQAYNRVAEYFGGDPIPDPFQAMSDNLELMKVKTKEYQHQFGSLGDTFTKILGGFKALIGLDNGGSGLLGSSRERGDPDAIKRQKPGESTQFGDAPQQGIDAMRLSLETLAIRLQDTQNGFDQVIMKGETMANIMATQVSSAFSGLGNAVISGMEGGQTALQSFGQFFVKWIKGMIAKMITMIITAVVLALALKAVGFGVSTGGGIASIAKGGQGIGASIKTLLGGGLGLSTGKTSGFQGLASGGFVQNGGMFQLHKDELVNLPAGSAVTPANIAQRGSGGGKLVAIVTGSDLRFVLEEEERRTQNSFG